MSELDEYIAQQEKELKTKQNQALRIGGIALAESLAKNGWTATLDMLLWVQSKKSNWILEELLIVLPGIYAQGDFISKLEAFECQPMEGDSVPGEQMFKAYCKMGHIV
jgi:hypothetical protein